MKMIKRKEKKEERTKRGGRFRKRERENISVSGMECKINNILHPRSKKIDN